MPFESSPRTLLDLLRSTLSLFEYYDGLEMPHEPVMDEVMACMRRAIAEISTSLESKDTEGRRPVGSEVPHKVKQRMQQVPSLEHKTG